MKASNPPGSVTSKKLAPSGELTVKVCGVPWGPNTNDPAGAPDDLAADPDGQLAVEDVEPFVLAVVHVKRRSGVLRAEVMDDRDAAGRSVGAGLDGGQEAHEPQCFAVAGLQCDGAGGGDVIGAHRRSPSRLVRALNREAGHRGQA
jgi:hypothetical protein